MPIQRKGSTMLQRQCTGDYKIKPVRQKLKELVPGVNFKNPVVLWIGFSTDEVGRVKPADVKWTEHRFPLIEQRWSRDMCVRYLRRTGFPMTVKSSCIGCPFHTDPEWEDLNEKEFESACKFDEQIREQGFTHPSKEPHADNRIYLHRDLVPLRQRPFERQLKVKKGQLNMGDLFGEDLEFEPGCDSWGCFG